MKLDLELLVDGKAVRIIKTGDEHFGFVGPHATIAELIEEMPGLDPGPDNDNGYGQALGDCLHRIFSLQDTRDIKHVDRAFQMRTSQQKMEEETLLGNPIVLFQTRDYRKGQADDEDWITDRVFLDEAEGRRWIDQQPHRYTGLGDGGRWRFYAVPAQGQLATIIKTARP